MPLDTVEYREYNTGMNKRLTIRENEVARLVAQKFTSREIGNRLGISKRTVEDHRLNIGKKLGSPAERFKRLLETYEGD